MWSAGLTACQDLEGFRGTFRGAVVGSDDPDCPPGESCSFIRRGFPEATVLVLDDFFPPPSEEPVIGRVTTFGSDAFQATPLERIGPLEHDNLSQYSFPGAGRVRNYIFIARPTAGALVGREAMVFVSLMDDDTIELRVLAGSGDESRGDHFGLFMLERQ